MFSRVLVANRGEIAVRVIRSCRELGIETIAIYSDADARAPHAILADRAVRIGPPPAAESYLRADAIIDAARREGAEAVHPGYGFLSENAAFASACADAGLVFVGPPPDAIARMGSKIDARRLMREAGVPVVPGETPADQSDAALLAAIDRIGYPALVKPSAGGGGIGMRVVAGRDEAIAAVQGGRRDADAAFGDGTLYVERLVSRPRHVEIQVFADDHDQVASLFERECSLQRRHQKVVEESPSPMMTPALREAMGRAAIAAARACGYRNAGTVEFLVEEPDGGEPRFHFLEMNTRLQVEHPVTEAVTGLDLVRTQLAVAAGRPLPWKDGAVRQRGHAIECRIYAEDPDAGFLPQSGPLLLYREPQGPGIRVDSGVAEGGVVPVHYDPLLAKLIVSAESRAAALARGLCALETFAVLGIRTNVALLHTLLQHPDVQAGRLDTGLLDRVMDNVRRLSGEAGAPAAVAVAAVAALVAGGAHAGTVTPQPGPETSPWQDLGGWRN